MKKPLSEDKLLHVSTAGQWRSWLKRHHRSKTEIWLVYYKKHSGKPRISYNAAVEEALCFGWIDSTVRNIDEDRFAQKFSPRRPGSRYSQANLERLRALHLQGRVAEHVAATLPDLSPEPITIAPDILSAIRSNRTAWKNFQRFSESYVRIRIAYIEGARRRPAEFKKRLAHFVRKTEANKMIGFGGVQKYY